MKEIFLKVLNLLKGVDGLKWVDKDKGQLEIFDVKPQVPFPCALIKVELPESHSIGGKLQDCTALITIKIGFDFFISETSAAAPDEAVQRSLAYYDLVDAVYSGLQGYADDEINELDRANARESINKGGYTIMQIPFSTTFTDETAAD